MIALIDGDSIAFMLGWHYREHRNIDEMHKAVDLFLENIFIMTGADMYYGALAGNEQSFRHDVYKVKPYKGNRKELDDHMVFWRPIVAGYLHGHYKFDCQSGLEADDLVYTASMALKAEGYDVMICSPDKDLKQIPGEHFDYRTSESCIIDIHQSYYNFFTLMLKGDDSDNISGKMVCLYLSNSVKPDHLVEGNTEPSSYIREGVETISLVGEYSYN